MHSVEKLDPPSGAKLPLVRGFAGLVVRRPQIHKVRAKRGPIGFPARILFPYHCMHTVLSGDSSRYVHDKGAASVGQMAG
jgi:hypothetical protein